MGRVRGVTPDVTVLIPTYQGARTIGRTLQALAGQSLDPGRFEVLVVANGPPCDTPSIVQRFRSEHPALDVRMVETTEPGAANARNLGLSAARGEHVTFLDDDDWVSSGFLEGLLAATGPGLVPMAFVVDVREEADGTLSEDRQNYVSRRLRLHEGTSVDTVEVPTALSVNAAKLVQTSLARRVGFRTDLRSGEDFVFWAAVFSASQFRIHVVPEGDDVAYYRLLRANSVSRQEVGYDFNVSQRLDCLAALDELAERTPHSLSTRELTRSMATGQSGYINAYLHEEPGDHRRIREDVRQRGVQCIDWSRVNRGLATSLTVAYCFTPYVDTSAMATARRIRAREEITDLITQDCDNVRDRDPESDLVAAEYVGARRVVPGPAAVEGWAEIEAFSRGAMRRFERLEERFGAYRTVHSQAMWVAAHLVAAQIKVRRPDIHWRAEFSEPLLIDSQGEVRAAVMQEGEVVEELRTGLAAAGFEPPGSLLLFEWGEKLAYALADEIVFTSEDQRDVMIGYCSDAPLARRAAAISSVSGDPTLPPP